MKKKNRLYLFLLLLIFIPGIVTNAAKKSTTKKEKVTVTGKTDYTQEKVLTWGENRATYMTTITLSDGNTAYCVDPGVPAPSGSSETGCTKKTLTGTDAATAMNIFNGSNDPVTIGTALRYANPKMRKTDTNADIIDAYTNPSSNVKISDKAKAAQELAQKARASANTAAEKAQNTTTVVPKATLKGNKVTYTNMPADTDVTITCTECTNPSKTFKVTGGNGEFTIDLKADSTKCTTGLIDYEVRFNGNGSVSGGSGGAGGSPSGSSGSQEKKTVCTQAVEYTCGNNSSAKLQRFVACNKTEEVPVDDSGNGDGDDGGTDIPIVADIVLPGTLNCNNICQEVTCPDPSNYYESPPSYPDGQRDALCDGSNLVITIIDEADYLKDDQDYIECCVLGNDKNKIDAQTHPICGTPEIYCTENYRFNTARSFPTIEAASKNGNITAGSYFKLDGGPLKDEAEYYCYSKNSTQGIQDAVVEAATKASTNNPNNTRTQITCTPYYETVYECTKYNCDEDGTNCGYDYVFDSTNSSDCPDGYQGTHSGAFTEGYKVTQTYNWVPTLSYNGTNFVLNWGWSSPVTYYSEWVYSSSECYDYDDGSSKSSSITVNDFRTDVENSMKDYEKYCNGAGEGTGLIDAMVNKIGSCGREVQFRYFDGEKLGVSATLEPQPDSGAGVTCKTNAQGKEICYKVEMPQKNEKCTKTASGTWNCSNAQSTHFVYNIGGYGNSPDFHNSTNSSAAISIKNEYIIDGTTICNNYSEGTRKFGNDCQTECNRETDLDENDDTTCTVGWPVAYDTPFGEHEYSFYVNNLDSCLNPGQMKFGNAPHNNWDIYCQYEVNGCHDCDFECDIGDDCSISFCDYDECVQPCLSAGCIYDNGAGLVVNYQPISLLNFDTAFLKGKNNYYSVQKLGTFRNSANAMIQQLSGGGITVNNSQNWAGQKGIETISDIYNNGNGEEIYAGYPQYRVVLTPASVRSIQQYNIDNGGYLNNQDGNQLDCSSPGGGYIVCRSNFLRNYLTNEAHAEFDENDVEFHGASEKGIAAVRKSGTGPAWK